MIVTVRDLLGGGDISSSVERDAFSVEATFGARMDILKLLIHDPAPYALALPDRREIVVYDAPAPPTNIYGLVGGDLAHNVVDPPWAVSAYNTYVNGATTEKTSLIPSEWTPRLFAGYLATPTYNVQGITRAISVSAQDYTYRLRSTVCNQAFAADLSDQYIVQKLFSLYRRDFTTDHVLLTLAKMPAISFPVHSLEQFMQRVIKITRAVYRVDYYKRLWYGPIGQLAAPFDLAENPNNPDLGAYIPGPRYTYGFENEMYSPDAASVSDKVWVVGRDYQSAKQTYTIPGVLVDGVQFQFSLPGSATKADITSIKVNGVSKTIGQSPDAGDIADQASFKNEVVVQPNPPTIAFKVTPPAAAVLTIVGSFRYPLIQIYTDPVMVAAVGGVFFEAVVRDRRITDLKLAQNVGKTYLATQGITLKGFSCTIDQRNGPDGTLIAPGQTIIVDAPVLFSGLGTPQKTFIITKVSTALDADTDMAHPYRIELELAEQTVGASDDIMQQFLDEQARVNAAIDSGDVNVVVEDLFDIGAGGTTEEIGFLAGTELVTPLDYGGAPHFWDDDDMVWGFFTWA